MTPSQPSIAPTDRYRCVFMGTPEFAVPTLRRLLDQQTVVAVFTQPDRPAGRGQRMTISPVKELAQAAGVPVLQPRSLRRDPAALARLGELAPRVLVVAAYGLILPPAALTVAPGGAVNVHASLLPRWRGAAPVARALLAGDEVTGVSIMRMDEGVDTGPVLARRVTKVRPGETTGDLTARLAELGADLLAATLPRWLAGELVPEAQDNGAATVAPRLEKAEACLDWRAPAAVLARRVRAMHPWPGAFAWLDGRPLKVHAATVVDEPGWAPLPVGTVVATPAGPAVATGAGWLRLDRVQGPGGRAMSGADFARGHRGLVGAVLAGPDVEPA